MPSPKNADDNDNDNNNNHEATSLRASLSEDLSIDSFLADLPLESPSGEIIPPASSYLSPSSASEDNAIGVQNTTTPKHTIDFLPPDSASQHSLMTRPRFDTHDSNASSLIFTTNTTTTEQSLQQSPRKQQQQQLQLADLPYHERRKRAIAASLGREDDDEMDEDAKPPAILNNPPSNNPDEMEEEIMDSERTKIVDNLQPQPRPPTGWSSSTTDPSLPPPPPPPYPGYPYFAPPPPEYFEQQQQQRQQQQQNPPPFGYPPPPGFYPGYPPSPGFASPGYPPYPPPPPLPMDYPYPPPPPMDYAYPPPPYYPGPYGPPSPPGHAAAATNPYLFRFPPRHIHHHERSGSISSLDSAHAEPPPPPQQRPPPPPRRSSRHRRDASDTETTHLLLLAEEYYRPPKQQQQRKYVSRKKRKKKSLPTTTAKDDDDSYCCCWWSSSTFTACHNKVGTHLHSTLVYLETFCGNLPLTIGGVALACANLGVDWFKFTEEVLGNCRAVHFHSYQCTFPEFPGCFACSHHGGSWYARALTFHWMCSAVAACLALVFLVKMVVAPRVVRDELSLPTTASPAGMICMTLNVCFAGRGTIGMMVVCLSSTIHLCICIWFIYMALAHRILPEPSWFPNTTGIGISAVKLWLYHPMAGHLLMAISLTLNFFFFPISMVRVALNRKISATVGWMQMSAPSVSLYALTIMAQPSFQEEHPDMTTFQRVHRQVYLPIMHVLFGLCLVGMMASVSSLVVRHREFFGKTPFSPAHVAFCVPTLSHANAVQAYRASLNSFSTMPVHSLYRVWVSGYWIFVLSTGTILTLVICGRFLYQLPAWTHLDTTDENEPPAPGDTTIPTTGETMLHQPFVSPAVLQANQTGVLVLQRTDSGRRQYRRTRQMTALGFEPVMALVDVERERELLLEWVGQHAPRRRRNTQSAVPGIDYSLQGQGVYNDTAASPWTSRSRRHRSNTLMTPPGLTQYKTFERTDEDK